MKLENRKDYRRRRHLRLRNKISGTPERPRFSVSVSNANVYVQLVDDEAGRTLASASSLPLKAKLNKETAKQVGEAAAKAAAEKGISLVVIDRGGLKYHGIVETVVETALQNGLKVNDEPFKPRAEKLAAKKPAAPKAKKEPKKEAAAPAKPAKKPAKEAK